MWDLPPRTLEELAARVGNSGMLTLMSMGAQEPQQTLFSPPEGELNTAPFPVPALDCQTADPTGLTAETPPGPAFDPAGLSDGYKG